MKGGREVVEDHANSSNCFSALQKLTNKVKGPEKNMEEVIY